jgi:hypothetical protein|tara:strand:- start:179 stop:676 length:498 start_codon:yes stop_codon:yes gene_type:complete
MIARFIFVGILVFFMSLPVHADTDKFSRVLELLDGALKCQAALSLTSNYNLIYRALNRGLEKVNPPEADKFKNKLDGQWKLIELIVDKSKSELVKLNSNMDFNKVEKRLFTEATNYLTIPIRTLKVNDEHIVNLMKLNSSCATRAPQILNLLIDEFPEDNPTVDP